MKSASSVYQVAIYLPDSYSLYTIGSVETPFRVANDILAEEKFRFVYVVPEPRLSGLPGFPACVALTDEFDCDLLVIVCETIPDGALSQAEKRKLQSLYQQGKTILTCYAGVFWLADSGLLQDRTAVVHWSLMDSFSERYDDISLSDHLYERHDRLITTAGQAAILDCLVDFLEDTEGKDLAYAVSDQLCMDRIRPAQERQRLPYKQFGGDVQPRLTMAIELMENNLEEPLSTDEIAELVHISRRQLERLFKRYLDTMPARYYLQLRLKKARQLLLTTHTSIVQIGLLCGFSSGPHFSSAYKAYYQITPREERSKLLRS
ncbi:GlxA family transcriptional regulator [Vibrio mangrovi]|uniref:HTH-type transcriptional regulator CdhR n=1 Tax=Vibrio mangrovi TaxID=474394 RepID=A0A1Y6ITZ1_9VIBR|nr:helix-turn-helix domain-containing protein [Vibrio mangrovi]MDW6004822.1 helix-turn-helix domain-containing protein [Vibrio mangrovi]SMS01114.1 HTH-type transcriptional regulator CdhR [Vibrio mangrovi]